MFIYSGFLLILSRLVYSQKNFNCSGTMNYTICRIVEPGGVFRLPKYLDAGIKNLEIGLPAPDPNSNTTIHNNYYSYEVMNNLELQKFKSLITLIIRVNILLFSFEVLKSPDTLTGNLFFLKNLETLEIRGANFKTYLHSWKFPPSLKRLTLSKSKYVSLNLSGCPRLEYLDLSINELTNLPSFSDPLPLIKQDLIFEANPLYTFTVDEIAGFCKADHIRFDYYSMGSERRKCECQRLKTWVSETGNKPGTGLPETFHNTNFFCNLTDLSSELCKDYTLKEAYDIRNKCNEEPTQEPKTSTGKSEYNSTVQPVISTNQPVTGTDQPIIPHTLKLLTILMFILIFMVIAIGCCVAFMYWNWLKARQQTVKRNEDEQQSKVDIEIDKRDK